MNLQRKWSGCRRALENVYPVLLPLLVWMVMAAFPAHAQITTATLNGAVTDPTGATVPEASVTVTNVDTGVSRTTVTNQAGEYSMPAIEPGKYSITISKGGFGTSQQNGLVLQVAQIATLNVVLKVGTASETIAVSASAAGLDTTSASLGTVIPEKVVTDLPLNGRQFSQLLQLAPGTVPIDNSQNAGKAPNFGSGAASPGVDGQTNRSNIFFLDGIIASNPFFGGFSYSPSIDAIQEFKAQSHTDQAEYGQATGGVVSVISRSGTNTFHGAAFEFFRNTVLNTKNEFATSNLPYHLNQFGGAVGGPIKKDKLFFFANYEGGRQSISPSANFSTVPTAAERAGNFSGLLPGNVTTTLYNPATYNPTTFTESPYPGNQVPVTAGMLALLNGIFPLPNQAPNSAGLNNYSAPTKNTTVGDLGGIRVDYVVGQKDQINGRFSENRATLAQPSSVANLFETGFSGENTGATWTHTFSPTLLGEITGGYNRLNIPQGIFTPVNQAALFTSSGVGAGFNENPGDTTVDQVPQYNFNGGNYTNFWNGGGPIGPMNIVQVGGTISKTEGRHSLKFGASYYHTWMYTNWNSNTLNFSYEATWNAACQNAANSAAAKAECPTYEASAGDFGGGGDPVAAMLLNLPISATRNLGNSGVNLIESTPAIFAQDSWKISPRLTINYGIRWDYASPVTEQNNRLSTYNFYNQTYDVVKGDKDLPAGPLPANTVVLGRNSITNNHYADFSPRLGIAYSIDPRTTVRAGIGRTFDDWGLPLQVGQQARGSWPSGLAQIAGTKPLNSAGLSYKQDGTLITGQNPFFGTPTIPASPLPAGGLGFQDSAWRPASSVQWNLEVERELGSVGNLSLAYVGSHTEHQTILQPYDTAPASTIPVANQTDPYPDKVYNSVGSALRSIGYANYNSFQAKLTRAFNNGLTYNAAFTYSNSLGFSSCNGDFSNECIQNLYDFTGDYGPTYLDVPLILTFNANYALPFGKGRQFANSGVTSVILGNWQVNTILAIRSGLISNPTNGFNTDAANSGDTSNEQRVNYLFNPEKGAPHTKAQWWNPTAFALPAPGTFGNASINSLRGPGYWNDDLSLFKDFPLTERYRVQFRAEAFDVFNHPNLGYPGNSSQANFSGTSTGADGAVTYKNGFDLITNTVPTTGPGANRNLQFALKLIF
jgi:Carboxypeptidase regulatory-like domain